MVGNFIEDLVGIAPTSGRGTYAFRDAHGDRIGFVQLISASRDEITIHRIWALESSCGHGSAMLRCLCELADRNSIVLKLTALPFGSKPYPLSQMQLMDWYAKYGFETRRRKMIRTPLKAMNVVDSSLVQAIKVNGVVAEDRALLVKG